MKALFKDKAINCIPLKLEIKFKSTVLKLTIIYGPAMKYFRNWDAPK